MTNAAGLLIALVKISQHSYKMAPTPKPSIPILTLMSVTLIMLVLRLMMQAMFKVMLQVISLNLTISSVMV